MNYNDWKQNPNNYINGVGDQFVNDFNYIYETYQNNDVMIRSNMEDIVSKISIFKWNVENFTFVCVLFQIITFSEISRKKANLKIDVNDVRDFSSGYKSKPNSTFYSFNSNGKFLLFNNWKLHSTNYYQKITF